MDELFVRFVRGLLILMILFGCAMTIVILEGDNAIGLRMVNAFASMFLSVLGLGSGYLLGRHDERKKMDKGKEAA
jgi:hypothetical protein